MGLPIRDCAGSFNNLGPRWPKLSAIDLTAKTCFECLYLISRLMPIFARFENALGAHTPTSHSTTISRFLCNFLSRVAPLFCGQHDSPSNLAESQYPLAEPPKESLRRVSRTRRGTGSRPDYLANRDDQRMRGHLHENRELAGEWAVGVWVHMDSWLRARNWRKSWNQIQTLKNCLYYCIYCAQVGSP